MIFVFCILQYDILKFSLAFTSTTTRIKLFKLGWFLCCCFFFADCCMPKMTTIKFLLLLMVVELTLLHRSEGTPFLFFHWHKPLKRPHCDSSRPAGTWANQWQQPFTYSCSNGKLIWKPTLGQVNWKQLTKVKNDQKKKQTKK